MWRFKSWTSSIQSTNQVTNTSTTSYNFHDELDGQQKKYRHWPKPKVFLTVKGYLEKIESPWRWCVLIPVLNGPLSVWTRGKLRLRLESQVALKVYRCQWWLFSWLGGASLNLNDRGHCQPILWSFQFWFLFSVFIGISFLQLQTTYIWTIHSMSFGWLKIYATFRFRLLTLSILPPFPLQTAQNDLPNQKKTSFREQNPSIRKKNPSEKLNPYTPEN